MSNDRLGRRDALVGIGAAAMGTAVGLPLVSRAQSSPRAGTTSRTPPVPEAGAAVEPGVAGLTHAPADDPVRALFGPLGEGSAVSTHWRLEALHRVRSGAIPVLMSTSQGERFAVEIFQKDPTAPASLASAGSLALYLVNRGDGGSPTGELEGLGVMALGRELETRLAAGAPIPRGLTTHRERTMRHPDGAFDIPLG